MILFKGCSAKAVDTGFATKSLLQTGLISIGFGAYIGLVVASKAFNGQKDLSEPSSKCKSILRLLIFAILMIPGGLFYLLNFLAI